MNHLFKIVEQIKGDALSQSDIDKLQLAYFEQNEMDNISKDEIKNILSLNLPTKKALYKAIEGLWFHDSSDYYNYLCKVVSCIMSPLHPDNYEVSRGKINSLYEYLKTPLKVVSS